MLHFKIFRQIDVSTEARDAVNYFRDFFENTRKQLKRNSTPIDFDQSASLVAGFIADAIDYAKDGSPAARPDPKTGQYPSSQARISVIKEIEALAAVLSNPKARVRARAYLSGYAERVLFENKIVANFGLESAMPAPNSDEASSGIVPLADKIDTVTRQIKRGIAARSATSAMIEAPIGSSVTLLKDSYSNLLGVRILRPWLSGELLNKIQMSVRRESTGLLSVRDIKDRLNEQERAIFSEYAAETAHNLVVLFNIFDRERGNQSHETLTTWTAPAPLITFVRRTFEAVAPSGRGDSFEDAFIPAGAKRLTHDEQAVVDMAQEGIDCVRATFEAIYRVGEVELFDGAGLEKIGKNERRRILNFLKEQKKINNNDSNYFLSEDEAYMVGEYSINHLINKYWRLRQKMILLRGYTIILGWYAGKLSTGHDWPNLEVKAVDFVRFTEEIFNPILDWGRELDARYAEGILYKDDVKPRAGGTPNPIPSLPAAWQQSSKVVDYGDHGHGPKFEEDLLFTLFDAFGGTRASQLKAVWTDITAKYPIRFPKK